MNKIDGLLLEALKCALKNETVQWNSEITLDEWKALFEKAETHQILPLIFEAVYRCQAAWNVDVNFFLSMKQAVKQRVMFQMIKTEEFINLYKHLNKQGIYPLVVKGLVCRSLYPNPDYRSSGDEDLLIREEEFRACHEAMLQYGMVVPKEGDHVLEEYEVPYGKKGSLISIELHKSLFPKDSDAYGELNEYFKDAHETSIDLEIREGVQVRTLNESAHLFYLICHAFKHFLHSGFGIRQVCDVVMFAKAHEMKINWSEVLRKCEEIHADKFAAAMFRIGENYLGIDAPKEWTLTAVDEKPMLADLMDSGIYGDSDMSRKHSSTMTLNAVSADKEGKTQKSSLMKTIFPNLSEMKAKYAYLEKYPFLLPVAWGTRIIKYGIESKNSQNNNALESVKIGNQRIELLRQYGIIESEK